MIIIVTFLKSYLPEFNDWREVRSEQDKKNRVNNVVGAMKGIDGPKKVENINRQLCHFFRADIGPGMAIAQALGVNVEDVMPKQQAKEKEIPV